MLKEGNIGEDDLNIFQIVDTVEDAVTVVEEFYSKYSLKPNF